MEENKPIEYINEDFPIMTADGAYTHFLDGYVSLYFYQNRILPPMRISNTEKESKGTREILGEIRMSKNAINKLIGEVSEGLSLQSAMEIVLDKKPKIWTDPIKNDRIGGKLKDMEMTETKENVVLFQAFRETYENINQTGKNKVLDLLGTFVHDNLDKLTEIKQKYRTKKKSVKAIEGK